MKEISLQNKFSMREGMRFFWFLLLASGYYLKLRSKIAVLILFGLLISALCPWSILTYLKILLTLLIALCIILVCVAIRSLRQLLSRSDSSERFIVINDDGFISKASLDEEGQYIFKWQEVSEIKETRKYFSFKGRNVSFRICKHYYPENVIIDIRNALNSMSVFPEPKNVSSKIVEFNFRPPYRRKLIISGSVLVFAIISFFHIAPKLDLWGLQRATFPGQHTFNLDKTGYYGINYEYDTVFNDRHYSTQNDQYKSLVVSVKSKESGEIIELEESQEIIEYNHNNRRVGFTFINFIIEKPGDYILKAKCKDESKIPEIVLGVRPTSPILVDLFIFLAVFVGGPMIPIGAIWVFVVFCKTIGNSILNP